MELKQLLYFSKVASFGSFSKAAIDLAIGQPVLSRQIRALETELNMSLLYRNGRGVALTEAGKVLKEHSRIILAQISSASSEISALCATPRGTIVMGMPPSVATMLAAPLMRSFKDICPLGSLRIVEGLSGHLLEWLVHGRVDIAILYDVPRLQNLLCEPLLNDQLFLIGAPDDPVKLPAEAIAGHRLADLPLILPSRIHGLRMVVDHALAAIDVDPRIEMEVDSTTLIINLVRGGAGYTVLPLSSVREAIDAGQLQYWPLVRPALTRSLVLATSSQKPADLALRLLMDCVRAQARSQRKEPAPLWAA